MNRMIACRVVAGALTLGVAGFAIADGPSYFRCDGGVVRDKSPLPDDFQSGASLVWRIELAPGHSTPCICGPAIFLTTYREQDKELATLAIDRATGKVRWKQVVPTTEIEPYHPVGSPASSTPACNGEQLFVFFGSYGLLSYDLDGKLLWSKRMGPFQDEFGASSSPVLVDGQVILNQDHDLNNFIMAIDQRSGETVWRTPREGTARSYSTPIVWEAADGRKELIVAGSLQLAAYDAEDGRKLWWVNGLSRIVDPTPVVANGLIYMATWSPGGDPTSRISLEPFAEALKNYDRNKDGKIERAELPEDSPVNPRFFRIDLNQDQRLDEDEWGKHARVFELAQNTAMAIQPGGKGDVTDTHVKWMQRRGLPTVPSSVVFEGVMYMVKDSGIITSLDVVTGEVLEQGRAAGRGNYYASVVAGDGKVYLASESGVVTVLKAGRKWEILSSHDFGERIMATPVVADGKMYLRTEEALYCFVKS